MRVKNNSSLIKSVIFDKNNSGLGKIDNRASKTDQSRLVQSNLKQRASAANQSIIEAMSNRFSTKTQGVKSRARNQS